MGFLAVLSGLTGWVYTLCWSLSFYPQPLLNARRRSTAGTTVDYPFINTFGFLAYLASTAALRYSDTVRSEYAARHHGLTPTAAANDVAFAAHALALSLVTVSQYLTPAAWGIARCAGSGRPSRFILGVAAGSVAAVACLASAVALAPAALSLDWLDVVYALGYVKLLISLVKYSPQVLANRRNRSTRGWSIGQITLDFAGGLLSTAQLFIDSYRQGDWSGLTGNPVKLALGNVSMAYDVVFFTQHYVLYRAPAQDDDEAAGERDALLAGARAAQP